jgi:proline dehydrogenase
MNKIQVCLSIINSEKDFEKINKKIGEIYSNLEIKLDNESLDFLNSKKTKLGFNLMEFFSTFSTSDIASLKSIFSKIENFEEIFLYGKEFHGRVSKILSYACERKCSVLYDAEQSYIQKILDASAYYYASIYNKDFPIVLETVQCYLKDAPKKVEDFITFYRENDLKLGMKIVRGAYLVEETKLSEKQQYERLNWDTIEQTHIAYNNVMRKLVSVYRNGDKVIFASHNENTIQLLTELTKGNSASQDVYCAQLIGISDHITLLSKIKGLKTFKYISFGSIEIMIPYLIRRAEETSIISKLQTQTSLLNDELVLRFKKPAFFVSFLLILWLIY